MPIVFRTAQKDDFPALASFTKSLAYLHRHLDWRDTLDWLGYEPFLIMEEDGALKAALACPPEPAEVAWIRLFASAANKSPAHAWKYLFQRAHLDLTRLKPIPIIASLALHDWYEKLLLENKFVHYQDIVVYYFNTAPPAPTKLSTEYQLRIMRESDFPAVLNIDHLAFEPIWRLSSDDLAFAAKKSSYCTVLEHNHQIVAYQMSSTNGMYAHLGRIAVHPILQHQRLGYTLLQNQLEHYMNQGNVLGVTLNTQDKNTDSIRLYQKAGFHETGERFPVYLYPTNLA